MTLYHLPEALGSAPCVFHSIGENDDCWVVERALWAAANAAEATS